MLHHYKAPTLGVSCKAVSSTKSNTSSTVWSNPQQYGSSAINSSSLFGYSSTLPISPPINLNSPTPISSHHPNQSSISHILSPNPLHTQLAIVSSPPDTLPCSFHIENLPLIEKATPSLKIIMEFPLGDFKSTHPMVTCSRHKIFKKKLFLAVTKQQNDDEPISVSVALQSLLWVQPMLNEFQAL